MQSGLPGWDKLLHDVADEIGYRLQGPVDPNNFEVLAQALHDASSHSDFWTIVSERICADAVPSRAHELIIGLPLKSVLTTNFDRLLIEASQAGNQDLVPVSAYPNLDPSEATGGRIFHIHGLCRDCAGTGDRLNGQSIVFTAREYDVAYGAQGRVTGLLGTVLPYRDLLVIGFSFTDFLLRAVTRSYDRAPSANAEQQMQETHTRYGIWPTDTDDPEDWEYPGYAHHIEPIFYKKDETHSGLVDVLTYLHDLAGDQMSTASCFCALVASRTARWWPGVPRGGGQQNRAVGVG